MMEMMMQKTDQCHQPGELNDCHQQASHSVKSKASDFWNRKLKSETLSEKATAGSRDLVKRKKETSD